MVYVKYLVKVTYSVHASRWFVAEEDRICLQIAFPSSNLSFVPPFFINFLLKEYIDVQNAIKVLCKTEDL